MNLGKAVEIPKLNEAMAIELGATLLGEAIIFTCGAILLVGEVVRRNKKEAAAEQARLDEMQAVMDRLRELEIEASRHEAQLREITRLCMALQGSDVGKKKTEQAPSTSPSEFSAKVLEASGMCGTSSMTVPTSLALAERGPIPVHGTGAIGDYCRPGQRRSQGLILSAIDSIVRSWIRRRVGQLSNWP